MQFTKYSVSKIAQITDGKLIGKKSNFVTKPAFDSRLTFQGEGVLFVALKGQLNDGHKYIVELYKRGVRAFLINEEYKIPENIQNASFIVVKDPLTALQKIAIYHRKKYKGTLLAITGSNGKTIVKEWLGQLMGPFEKITRSPRSYNSQIGVPVSVWQINKETTFGIFEAGISKPGEMAKLAEILAPDIGLITNIGSAHQENFKDITQKLEEKLSLFETCDTIFYCRDNSLIHAEINKKFANKNLLTWGKDSKASLRLMTIEKNNNSKLLLKWKDDTFKLTLPFTDNISIENSLPIILLMLFKDLKIENITQGIAALQPVAMRMEQKEGINGSLIINDSYNSDFTSLEVALEFLQQQGLKKKYKKTLILSDLQQTGMEASVLYPRVSDLLKARQIDRLIGVGEEIMKYASYFRAGDCFFSDTQKLMDSLHSFSFKNEAILIKGARKFEFEKVSEQLELKQHSTLFEINLNALLDNLNFFRKKLKPSTHVLAMVKAFGYGSGAYELAAMLQHHNVDYLGVAYADEGIELRQAGITMPIMVMNPEVKSFGQMLKYNLEPEIYSIRILKGFIRALAESGEEKANIHIKVDTGMFRLGFLAHELPEVLDILKYNKAIKVKSVFTHLVGSDDPNHDEFTKKQTQLFLDFTQELEQKLNIKVWRHILNSAGVERFPQYQFEMVRLGIGLFGISAVNRSKLQNVVTLKTYISQIKPAKAGETIGYNRAGKMKNDGLIAVLPIGYADGFNRNLGNGKGQLMIKGELKPVVGNVCMDMCMVDVTGLDVKEGDEVIVFGDDYSISEMAKILNTIAYEVLTSIGRRVKRVYFRE